MPVTFDATATTASDGTASLTWNHTCTGANLYLIVIVQWRLVSTISATYNGVAMTDLGGINNAGDYYQEIFGLANPATGVNQVAVAFGTSRHCVGGSVSAAGVDQIASIGTVATNTGTGAPFTLTVTTGTDELVVAGSASASAATTTGAGQTEDWKNNDPSSFIFGLGSHSTQSANEWDSGTGDWTTIGVSLKPVAVASTDTAFAAPIFRSRMREW